MSFEWNSPRPVRARRHRQKTRARVDGARNDRPWCVCAASVAALARKSATLVRLYDVGVSHSPAHAHRGQLFGGRIYGLLIKYKCTFQVGRTPNMANIIMFGHISADFECMPSSFWVLQASAALGPWPITTTVRFAST